MRFKLIEKRQETPTIYSFIFKPETNVRFSAGQFIDITVPHENPDNRGIRRHFSISSSPTEDFLMITTRILDKASSFKKALLNLLSGTVIEIGEPHGSFVLPEETRNCLFITGGVGITPVRSMLKFAMDKKLQNRLVLLYSNVTPEEIAFHNFLNELKTQNPKLDIVYTITKPEESQPKAEVSWSGRVGRIDEKLIQEKMEDIGTTRFYISGPIPLVDTFYDLLKKIEVSEASIKRENFPGY